MRHTTYIRLYTYFFILLFFAGSFSMSFASSTKFISSHNEQKMTSRLSEFLDTHDAITPKMKEKAIQKVIDFNQNFNISSKNEAKTLRRLFFSVQETFLKEYVLYASFFQMLDSGKFDCLTGSLLYAIFLEEIKLKGGFNYQYNIVQMPTHIFIKIELSDKSEIIFESTSPVKGFIATQNGVALYLQEQLQEQNKIAQEAQQKETLLLSNQQLLNNYVTLENASALLYFNQGVLFFNQRKFGKSLRMAKNALFFEKNAVFYELAQLSLKESEKNNTIADN